MPPRFSIFSCSQTVAEQILNKMKFDNLFEFAQLSKRAFVLVQSLPKRNALNVIMSISSTSYARIYLDNYLYDDGELEWKFYSKRDSERYEMENSEEQVVVKLEKSRESTELVFVRTSSDTYGCSSNSVDNVIQFVQYLDSLFNVYITHLHLRPSEFHNLGTIQSVEQLKKSRHVAIMSGTVSHKEMRQLLGGFETNWLQIFCSPEPNFTYDRMISIPWLQILEGSWFNGAMLLKLNCNRFDCINSCSITEEHLNVFLREWLKNNTVCGRINELSIRPAYQSEPIYDDNRPPRTWDMDKITQNLSSLQLSMPIRISSDQTQFFRKNGDILNLLWD